MKPLLSPKNDAVFKMLFGDEQHVDLLTGFLQATLDLPPEDYAEVTLANTHLSRETAADKECILDVKVQTASGNRIDVEIQVCPHSAMEERVVLYLSRMVNEQIGKGEPHEKIQRAICILITDYRLLPDNEDYHNRYRLYNPKNGSQFTDLLEVDTLELPKLREEDGTSLWSWLCFLKVRDREELKMLEDKNPQLKKAAVRLLELSEDEEARMLAESREIGRRDIETYREDARREGLREGLREGRLAVARNLLNMGLPIDQIVKGTGLTRDEVQKLLH